MIPNPVQRRSARSKFRQAARSTDDLVVPCATEGGMFRAPAPARPPAHDAYFDGPRINWGRVGRGVWLGVCAGLIALVCWSASS